MLKTGALILAIFLLASSAFGGETEALGVKGGGVLATVVNVPENRDVRAGFAIGGYFTYRMSEMFFLQPELFYLQKGYRDKVPVEAGPGANITVSYKERYDYIHLPLLVGYELPFFQVITPRLMFGPVVTYFIRGTTDIDPEVSGAFTAGDIDDTYINRWGTGGGGGLNMSYLQVTLELRYFQELTDHLTYENGKNQVISLLIGYPLFLYNTVVEK